MSISQSLYLYIYIYINKYRLQRKHIIQLLWFMTIHYDQEPNKKILCLWWPGGDNWHQTKNAMVHQFLLFTNHVGGHPSSPSCCFLASLQTEIPDKCHVCGQPDNLSPFPRTAFWRRKLSWDSHSWSHPAFLELVFVKFDETYIGFSHPLQLYISNSFVCCWSIRKSHVKSAFSSLKLTNLIANLYLKSNNPLRPKSHPHEAARTKKPPWGAYKWCFFQFHEGRVFC